MGREVEADEATLAKMSEDGTHVEWSQYVGIMRREP